MWQIVDLSPSLSKYNYLRSLCETDDKKGSNHPSLPVHTFLNQDLSSNSHHKDGLHLCPYNIK